MYKNVSTEMSRNRDGQSESARPKTEMAQTATAQTETARPHSRVPDI